MKNISLYDFKIHIPIIDSIDIVGSILSGHTFITYLAFIGIIIMSVIMYQTKFGIYVRVVGENEEAAISLGLKTKLYKYLEILLGRH